MDGSGCRSVEDREDRWNQQEHGVDPLFAYANRNKGQGQASYGVLVRDTPIHRDEDGEAVPDRARQELAVAEPLPPHVEHMPALEMGHFLHEFQRHALVEEDSHLGGFPSDELLTLPREKSLNMSVRDRGVVLEEPFEVDPFGKVVDEDGDRDTRAGEAERTTHDLRIDRQDSFQARGYAKRHTCIVRLDARGSRRAPPFCASGRKNRARLPRFGWS